MTEAHDFFAPPPFKPAEALQRLQRELRALGLVERAGVFERQGLACVKARVHDGALQVSLAKTPARAPQWQPRTLKDTAQVRDFVAAVKQQWARHDEGSE